MLGPTQLECGRFAGSFGPATSRQRREYQKMKTARKKPLSKIVQTFLIFFIGPCAIFLRS